VARTRAEESTSMGKVAFVFPGQGAQKVGMGKEAHALDAAARKTFESADAALGPIAPSGRSLSQLCFEGPEADLKLTAITQPAILTASVALLQAFGEHPDVVAGHSLGEYTANVCAGTLTFEHAVKLVRVRGQYMQDAVPVGEGAMAAVMGLARPAVDEVCRGIDAPVDAVNYNSPQQTVIAGSADGVRQAAESIKAAGGKVMPLPVSAPFHSRLMRPAEEKLAPHLADTPFNDPAMPIYVNADVGPVRSGGEARDALVRQVSRPVRWQEIVERMVADGVTLFVEVGPGRVLTGLVGRITKDVAKVSVQAPADFEGARAAIAEARADS
jgi:[acyl-carrier-protein] S-malonyltransferase